jgi:UDP:flavonoid glycosyltransferase YjiC (YdhE family)
MKVVFVTSPAPGRVNPMLGIVRILLAERHEVVAFTGSAFKSRVKEIGIEFRPIAASADRDLVGPFSKYPELKTTPPGLVSSLRLCIDTIPGHSTTFRYFRSQHRSAGPKIAA